MMRILAFTLALVMAMSVAAFAQGDGKDAGSGIITLEQMQKQLQFFKVDREGIHVHFVLPIGWELVEEGVDPVTGELEESMPAYVLLSRSPVHNPEDPTDLIFELSIYRRGLTEDLPADVPAEERTPGRQLWNFLNEQLSINLKGGLTCRTKLRDIDAKPYGLSSPDREPTWFVPLAYDTPEGAELYTFTSFTGDTVWSMKFLVAEGQIENYGALIALVLDNTFGLTDAQYKEMTSKVK